MLRRLVGDGPAMFFRDACGFMAEQPPRATATHQTGHALREVESALRSVLQVEKVRGHRESILAVLQDLEIPKEDIDAEFWLSIIGEGNAKGLAARAHRPGLDLPRPLDGEFRDFFRDMESLLERVLDSFQRTYIEVFRRLDKHLEIQAPSESDADKLRQSFPMNQITQDHFFRNASAAWVGPLTAAGFFASPPAPQLNDDGSVVFLPWPQSAYLVRVVHEAPDAVLTAALKVPKSDNSYVMWNLVQIATALPAEAAVHLIPTIVSAIPGRYGLIAADGYGALVKHLAKANLATPAMPLAKALLSDPPTRGNRSGTIRGSEFSEILRDAVPALTVSAGTATFELLLDALEHAVSTSASPAASEERYDGSLIWRPAIERNDAYHGDDSENALVDAIRLTAITITENATVTVDQLVEKLGRHQWLIFRRLTLDFLRSVGDQGLPLAAQKLSDPAFARDDRLDREYLLLARSVLAQLNHREQLRYYRMIAGGPDTAAWAKHFRRHADKTPATALVDAYMGRWKRDRLAAAGSLLPPHLRTQYRTLTSLYGDAPDPTAPPRPSFTTRGNEISIGVDDLSAMDTPSLVAFLQSWQPPQDWRQIERSAIRGPLTGAIQREATRRSADAELFTGLRPEDITAVSDGLWQGATEGQAIDWTGLLPLCRWIDTQAQAELAQGVTTRDARRWQQARMGMLRVLITGTNDSPSALPPTTDDAIWGIIKSCADDPDPTPDDESQDDEYDTIDTLTANSVRPISVWAAIAYGRLLRRRDPANAIDAVLSHLERHLDLTLEPSLAVHAVYGSYFQTLLTLDENWTREHIDDIYPEDPKLARVWGAAWNAHLQRPALSDGAWHVLRDQYRRAINELAPNPSGDWELARFHYLGRHLFTRYYFGGLVLDEPDHLIQRFYQHAPTDVAKQILAGIGHTILKETQPNHALVQRLVDFWHYRLSSVEQGSDPSELVEFDGWFVSGKFDKAWSLQQLLIAISRAPNMSLDHSVLGQLEALAPAYPLECLAIINKWLENSPDYWELRRNREQLGSIIDIGAESSVPEMMSLAREVASNLTLNGLYLGNPPQATTGSE